MPQGRASDARAWNKEPTLLHFVAVLVPAEYMYTLCTCHVHFVNICMHARNGETVTPIVM
jgi:hypothetical protein